MRGDLDSLFLPFTCGSLALSDRFVMSPMTQNFSPGGVPGAGVVEYYARRAHTGLIITEGAGPDHPAALGDGTMGRSALPVMYGEEALGA
jgi:2,4-dienoyl-CoA reductase-like NADH-dependent reductase (Old Yellow Enzyme family)